MFLLWIGVFILMLYMAGFSIHWRTRGKNETEEEWNRDDDFFE